MTNRKQRAGGRSCPCSLEPMLTNIESLKSPELKAILDIYIYVYQNWSIGRPIQTVIRRRHIVWAMSILCRFLESDTYLDIDDRSVWFGNNKQYLAAGALHLAAGIEEDVPYDLRSYAIIFGINLRKLNAIEELIWNSLDNNLLILRNQQWVWDDVIPQDIYPN